MKKTSLAKTFGIGLLAAGLTACQPAKDTERETQIDGKEETVETISNCDVKLAKEYTNIVNKQSPMHTWVNVNAFTENACAENNCSKEVIGEHIAEVHKVFGDSSRAAYRGRLGLPRDFSVPIPTALDECDAAYGVKFAMERNKEVHSR